VARCHRGCASTALPCHGGTSWAPGKLALLHLFLSAPSWYWLPLNHPRVLLLLVF
jgi:hypothetical protein